MTPVRVVTDSACDLSVDQAASAGLTVVPLAIRFGDTELVDRVDLSTDEFWSRCVSSPTLPETAAPSPGAFQQAFEAAESDGFDGVLCITLSGAVSATLQSAMTAARSVGDRFPVRTVDSRSLTLGLGLMSLELARVADGGASLDELTSLAESLVRRTRVFGVVNTLDHLAKGGRIGGARALLGSLLSIKPVLTLVDGVVEEESKQRTRARSLQYLADKVRGFPSISWLGVANGAADDIGEFLDLLGTVGSDHPLVVSDLGPVVGTHAGPGAIGVCLIVAE
ncbi:MAG: DegV family protein [Acidimicrobiales bacterium]